MTRTIIVGDVHGCLDELTALLEKVEYKPHVDQLIFVGDLINKGPYSLEVLQFVKPLPAIFIKGNHERAFIKYLKRPRKVIPAFEELKAKMGAELESWRKWMKAMPLFHETEEYLVVHAGIIPDTPVEEIKAKIITNIRTWDGIGKDLNNPDDPPWFDLYKGQKLVVFGHWATMGLVVRDNVIGLDSGCVYGKELSALVLPERRIVQVKAKQVYKSIDFKVGF
ncbi:MAG: metallophosphoesterase [Oligoflexales bacterium]